MTGGIKFFVRASIVTAWVKREVGPYGIDSGIKNEGRGDRRTANVFGGLPLGAKFSDVLGMRTPDISLASGLASLNRRVRGYLWA